LFLDLLQRDYVNKSAVAGMEAKTVDVHIHYMRARLKPHRIAIQTIWGVGYRLEAADRRRAMDLILQATWDDAVGRSQDAPRRASYRGPPGLQLPSQSAAPRPSLASSRRQLRRSSLRKRAGHRLGGDCLGWLATWPQSVLRSMKGRRAAVPSVSGHASCPQELLRWAKTGLPRCKKDRQTSASRPDIQPQLR
jgi:hypothetical protein